MEVSRLLGLPAIFLEQSSAECKMASLDLNVAHKVNNAKCFISFEFFIPIYSSFLLPYGNALSWKIVRQLIGDTSIRQRYAFSMKSPAVASEI